VLGGGMNWTVKASKLAWLCVASGRRIKPARRCGGEATSVEQRNRNPLSGIIPRGVAGRLGAPRVRGVAPAKLPRSQGRYSEARA
jgi:hypothetical protein